MFDRAPTACLYCLPPVLNGHLKWNHTNKTKNNLSSKKDPMFVSENQFQNFEF